MGHGADLWMSRGYIAMGLGVDLDARRGCVAMSLGVKPGCHVVVSPWASGSTWMRRERMRLRMVCACACATACRPGHAKGETRAAARAAGSGLSACVWCVMTKVRPCAMSWRVGKPARGRLAGRSCESRGRRGRGSSPPKRQGASGAAPLCGAHGAHLHVERRCTVSKLCRPECAFKTSSRTAAPPRHRRGRRPLLSSGHTAGPARGCQSL